MRPLCAKEIRLLQPAFVAALLLAVVPVWLLPRHHWDTPEAGSLVPFIFGALLLALSGCGREFSLQTFSLALAQPVERRRLWQAKASLSAAAMLIVLLAWSGSCALCLRTFLHRNFFATEEFLCGAAAAVVAFAGGLWTTLLVRQVAAGFWLTILAPGLIAGCLGRAPGWLVLLALGLYAAAGVWWGRRLFLRAQDTAWTGGEVALPGWRGARAAAERRKYRPWAALFWKELGLHRIALLGMGCLFLLHLAVVWLRRGHEHSVANTLQVALDVFGGIWFLVPLLVSSLSVAEERKLGTLAQQLTLPLSRRVQFGLKLLFALVIGGVLSTALLCAAEGLGVAIHAGPGLFVGSVSPADFELLALCLMGFAFIGFYASTLARNVIQALPVGVVATLGVFTVASVAPYSGRFLHLWIWRGLLIYYIGGPLLAVTLAWLAWRNFAPESGSGHLWRRNALVVLAALCGIVLLTTATYHRAWEWLTPVDGVAGPARIAGTKPVQFHPYGACTLTAILPDGRLWVDRLAYQAGRPVLRAGPETGFARGGHWASLAGSQMPAGSNWAKVVANSMETVAIRADGTLWVSEKARSQSLAGFPGNPYSIPPFEAASGLVRFGSETNWLDVVREPVGWSVVLLKRDGTLWRLGELDHNEKQPWPGWRHFVPQRLVAEPGWERILADRWSRFLYAWKRDGTAWGLHTSERGERTLTNETEVVVGRLAPLDNTKWRSLTHLLGEHEVGLREDGTLWSWTLEDVLEAEGRSATQLGGGGPGGRPSPARLVAGGASQRKVQRGVPSRPSWPWRLGPDADWADLDGDYQALILRKMDGSIWRWGPEAGLDPASALHPAAWGPPLRLGARHDWVGVGCVWGKMFSLAADGNVFAWWEPHDRSLGESPDQPMLAPSRKAALVENIFAGSASQ